MRGTPFEVRSTKYEVRGSVLIAVIWTLSLLAVFTVAVNRRASQELLLGQWVKGRILSRSLAEAGIERALFAIQKDLTITYDAFNEAWASNEKAFKEKPLGAGNFSVMCGDLYGACDEAARINVNTVTEEILKNLFLAVDGKMENKRAAEIAQSIMDWRDSDDAAQTNGAESHYYQSLSSPYEPRNELLESTEELLMIRGMDRRLYDLVEPYVTVYTDGKVNFNTASETALQALGLSKELAAKVIEYRQGVDRKEGTEDDGVFLDTSAITPSLSAATSFSSEEFAQVSNIISAGLVSVKSDAFRIRSFGRLIKNNRTDDESVTCVITREGSILYWREGGSPIAAV